MTTRLEAAREAVHNTVRMYAPVHISFSEEATRRLNVALAEVEAAAVEAAKPHAPPVLPAATGPAPDLVKLNEPTQAQPGAVGNMGGPDPATLPPASVETAPPPFVGKPTTKGGKSKG